MFFRKQKVEEVRLSFKELNREKTLFLHSNMVHTHNRESGAIPKKINSGAAPAAVSQTQLV
mgnify:FL=1